jgi:hypothetical protein
MSNRNHGTTWSPRSHMYIAGACLALVACAAGEAPGFARAAPSTTEVTTQGDWTTGDLATSTGDAAPPPWADIADGLRKFCSCHTAGGAGDGGVADIDDPDQILKYLVFGDAFRSPLLQPLLKGLMPPAGVQPELDPAFTEAMIAWVNALPPDTCDRVELIDPDDVYTLALADARAHAPAERGGLRYLSLLSAVGDAPCRADIDRLQRHVTLAVNLVARSATPTQLRAIDPSGLVLALSLKDIDWDAAPDDPWQTLVAATPRAARFVGTAADALRSETATTVPVAPADAVVFTMMTDATVYNALVLHPGTLAELEDELGVDAVQDYYNDEMIRAGVRESEYALFPELLERHATAELGGGYLWRKGLFNGQGPGKDLFADPLNAKPDAFAVLYSRTNGLPGFFIANADGERLDVVPGPLARNVYGSAAPISCARCHISEGPRTFTDEVRAHALDHQELFDNYADFDKILALYPPADQVLPVLDKDRARHKQALAALDINDELVGPVWSLVAATAAPLPARRAAAELGVSEQDLRDKLLLLPDPLHVLASGTVTRADFDAAFGAALCALKPGVSARPDC